MNIQFPSRREGSPIPAQGLRMMLSRFPEAETAKGLQRALEVVVGAYDESLSAHARISQDATLTEAARVVRSATVAREKMAAAMSSLEQARSHAATFRGAMERKIEAALSMKERHFSDVHLLQELRSYLRSQPPPERYRLMLEAIKAGEPTVLDAIATAPAMLSGLPADGHKQARDALIAMRTPGESIAAKTITDAEMAADQIVAAALQGVANAIDFESADALNRKAA